MTITEMKAMCYDILAEIEFLQKKLQETNQAIAAEMQKAKDEKSE